MNLIRIVCFIYKIHRLSDFLLELRFIFNSNKLLQ